MYLNNLKKLFSDLDLHYFRKIDSTNNFAKKISLKSNNNGIVIAKTQTGGIGRKSRSFFSYKGGLYFSLYIKGIDNKNITPLCAVAVKKAIKKLNNNLNPQIKWVNDIYLNNKKVCGILCERSSAYKHLIIGIGINTCKPKKVPKEIENIFGYINKRPSKKYNLALLKLIVDEIFALNYTDDFYEEYKKDSLILGKTVTVITETEEYNAKVIGFNDSLNLIVLKDDKEITLTSGDVSLKF